MNNHGWHHFSPNVEANYAPWLRNHGSLTQRIQQRCTRFAVRGVRSGLARIAPDEAALLDVAPGHLAYSREVFLYADGRPVVFAHSACARQHLRGAWSAVQGLGNKPLGALLFAHPLVERKPLHYKALRNMHPLYQCAAAALSQPPGRLWARRSVLFARRATAGDGSFFAGNS
jgi:chorismate--pyruvate lyase